MALCHTRESLRLPELEKYLHIMDSDLKRIHSAHVLVSYPNLQDATSSNSWRRIGECAVTHQYTRYTLINNVYDITGIMFTAFENGKVVFLGKKNLFFYFIKDTKIKNKIHN